MNTVIYFDPDHSEHDESDHSEHLGYEIKPKIKVFYSALSHTCLSLTNNFGTYRNDIVDNVG